MRRIFFSISVLVAILAVSCSDLFESINKYAPEEKIFPGIYDTIYASIGINRVELDFMKNGRNAPLSLGRATKTVVVWDDQERTLPLSTWVGIGDLTEPKMYRFVVYTEDDQGNRSVPLEIEAMPYLRSNIETITIPDPRITNTIRGVLVSWPASIVNAIFEYRGGTYTYTDRYGDEHNGEFEGSFLSLRNLTAEDRVTIKMTHRIVPKINKLNVSDNEDPMMAILDEIPIDRDVTFIVPYVLPRIDVIPLSVRTTKGPNWIEFDLGGAYDIESFLFRAQDGSNNTEDAPIQNFQIEFWKFQNVALGSSTVVGNIRSPFGEWRVMEAKTDNDDPEFFSMISAAVGDNDNGYWTNRVRFIVPEVSSFDWNFPIELYILEPDVSPQRPTNDYIKANLSFPLVNSIPKAWWYPPYLRTNVGLYRNTIASSIRSSTAWDGIGHEGPSNAVDGLRGVLTNSRWCGRNPSPDGSHLTIEWDQDMPIPIDGMSFWNGSENNWVLRPRINCTFYVRDTNDDWVAVHNYVVSSTTLGYNIYFADWEPVLATGVRMFYTDAVYATVFQVEAYTTVKVPGYGD